VALGGTGNCTTGQSSATPLGTIQAALNCAHSTSTASSPDTIQVAAGRYSENLTVDAYVTIAGQATVDGGRNGRVVTVDSPYIVTISGLTITGGLACSGCGGDGGGIANFGTLSLINSTVSGNTACSASGCTGHGGGIANRGALSLSNGTVSGNTACSASGCTGQGGGIYNDSSSAVVRLANDTITYNAAYSMGGSGTGGGIYNSSGSPTLQNVIITGNTPNNCYPGSLC
jgi:nitrous oxidase accessory protein NosD